MKGRFFCLPKPSKPRLSIYYPKLQHKLMKATILPLLTLVILFAGCSKDKAPEPLQVDFSSREVANGFATFTLSGTANISQAIVNYGDASSETANSVQGATSFSKTLTH